MDIAEQQLQSGHDTIEANKPKTNLALNLVCSSTNASSKPKSGALPASLSWLGCSRCSFRFMDAIAGCFLEMSTVVVTAFGGLGCRLGSFRGLLCTLVAPIPIAKIPGFLASSSLIVLLP
jgi:hypothetical protein